MKRILILGGTSWLGSAIAQQHVYAGNDVTVLDRGRSGTSPEGVKFVRADSYLLGTSDAVKGDFDDIVELVYKSLLVDSALNELLQRSKHCALISSIVVCASPWVEGGAETIHWEYPKKLTQYPVAIVVAERRSRLALGDKLSIVRPRPGCGSRRPQSDRLGTG